MAIHETKKLTFQLTNISEIEGNRDLNVFLMAFFETIPLLTTLILITSFLRTSSLTISFLIYLVYFLIYISMSSLESYSSIDI